MYGHWRRPSRVGASDFFVLRATLAKPSCQPGGSMVPEPLAPRAERACAGPARSPIPPVGRDLRSTLLPRLRQRKPPLTIRTQMFRRVLRSPLVLAVWIPPRRRALQGPRRREARRNAQSRRELPNDRRPPQIDHVHPRSERSWLPSVPVEGCAHCPLGQFLGTSSPSALSGRAHHRVRPLVFEPRHPDGQQRTKVRTPPGGGGGRTRRDEAASAEHRIQKSNSEN